MREHTYHLDRGSHSITVAVHAHEVELLVDGRTVDVQPPPHDHDTLLHGALPEEPPQDFEIRLTQRRHGRRQQQQRCVLSLGGGVESVPERTHSWY